MSVMKAIKTRRFRLRLSHVLIGAVLLIVICAALVEFSHWLALP